MCHQNFRVNKRGLSPQPHGLGDLLLKNNSTEWGGEVEGEAREGGEGLEYNSEFLAEVCRQVVQIMSNHSIFSAVFRLGP